MLHWVHRYLCRVVCVCVFVLYMNGYEKRLQISIVQYLIVSILFVFS